MRTLGIDYGTKRIGVAVSDPSGTIAFPLEVIPFSNLKSAVVRIIEICREKEVGTIVVGRPVNMDGTIGQMCADADNFAERLRRETGKKVIGYDERLTTAIAEKSLIGADMRRDARKNIRDMVSAQIILQNYLDSIGVQENAQEI